jgi:hypothetical protein
MKTLSVSPVRTSQAGVTAAVLALLAGTLACVANAVENEKAHHDARTTGLYQVHIINEEEREKVAGSCKFVRAINADDDPVRRPMDAELRDYLRAEAVYLGADTIYIDGRIAEAYICGPSPLNPDGTRRAPEAPPK